MSASASSVVSETSSVTRISVNQTVTLNIATVGVVLLQWNNDVRQRINQLGAQLGQAGLKMQLFTVSDIMRLDDRIENLQGIVFQLPDESDQQVKQRFDAMLQNRSETLFTHGRTISAFSGTDTLQQHVESALVISLKAHTNQCLWLGVEADSANPHHFSTWCQGIARSARQTDNDEYALVV